LLLVLLLLVLPGRGRADDLTGMPYDDPKDLMPTSSVTTTTQATGSSLFLPLPAWSRGSVMPPLPDQLKPMGRKPVVASATTTTTAPLAPPKDATATPVKEETTAPSKPSPASDASNPALVTVSPFLQWIKANPQAAAAQARQAANSYNTPPPAPNPNAPAANHGAAVINGQNDSSADPYWLPPLIDSADIVPTVVGGSAAIYSTPQR
jgi:hypothetical protein